MKLNLLMYFFFVFETPLKDFPFYYSILIILFDLDTYKHGKRKVVHIFLVNFSSKLPMKLKNSKKNQRKINFSAI